MGLRIRYFLFMMLLMVMVSAVDCSKDSRRDLPRIGDYSDVHPLLDQISIGEGTSDEDAQRNEFYSGYDVPFSYGSYALPPKPLTEMNISEIQALQSQMIANGAPSGAVGRYQITKGTLADLIARYKIDSSTIFNASIQDQLAIAILKECGYDNWIDGTKPNDQFQYNLAGRWASIEDPFNPGNTRYNGQSVGSTIKDLQAAMYQTKNINGQDTSLDDSLQSDTQDKIAENAPNISVMQQEDVLSPDEKVLFSVSQGLEPIANSIPSSLGQSTDKDFKKGDKIETTDLLNVRSIPGLPIYSTNDTRISEPKSKGSTGTILEGPVDADGFTWWKIQYDDGTIGWSQDKRLEMQSIQETSQKITETENLKETQKTSFGVEDASLGMTDSVPANSNLNPASIPSSDSKQSLDFGSSADDGVASEAAQPDSENRARETFGEKMAKQARSLVGKGIKYSYGAEVRKDGKILTVDEIKETGIDCAELTWWAANTAAGLSSVSEDSPLSESYSGGQWSDTNKIEQKSNPAANTIRGKMSNGDTGVIKSGPITQGNHEWYLIESEDGVEGYVSGNYLELASKNTKETSSSDEEKFNIGDEIKSKTNDLNIRSVPSVSTGAKVSILPSSEDLKPGDLLFLDTGTNPNKGKTEIDHVAVYVGDGNVVQASTQGDVTEMKLEDWQKMPAGNGRPYGDYFYGYGRLKAAKYDDKVNFGGINFTSIKLNYISVSEDRFGDIYFDLILKAKKTEEEDMGIDIQNTTKIGAIAFMTGLIVPDNRFWVNLAPWEPDRIIDEQLKQSEVGRIMLEADLQMKRDFSNYQNPCTNRTGKVLHDLLDDKREALIQQCMENFPGEIKDVDNIWFRPVTRHWIVPDKVYAYTNESQIYIINATMAINSEPIANHTTFKVFHQSYEDLSDDCIKAINNSAKEYGEYYRELTDRMILPYVMADLNHGEKYAELRDVYVALSLAQWYKLKITPRMDIFQIPYLNEDSLDSSYSAILKAKNSWSYIEIWNKLVYSFEYGEYKCCENTSTKTSYGYHNSSQCDSTGGVEFSGIIGHLIEIRGIPKQVQELIDSAILDGFVDDGNDSLFGDRLHMIRAPIIIGSSSESSAESEDIREMKHKPDDYSDRNRSENQTDHEDKKELEQSIISPKDAINSSNARTSACPDGWLGPDDDGECFQLKIEG
jgi:cell wall-associated NlpC family hydrolase